MYNKFSSGGIMKKSYKVIVLFFLYVCKPLSAKDTTTFFMPKLKFVTPSLLTKAAGLTGSVVLAMASALAIPTYKTYKTRKLRREIDQEILKKIDLIYDQASQTGKQYMHDLLYREGEDDLHLPDGDIITICNKKDHKYVEVAVQVSSPLSAKVKVLYDRLPANSKENVGTSFRKTTYHVYDEGFFAVGKREREKSLTRLLGEHQAPEYLYKFLVDKSQRPNQPTKIEFPYSPL